MNMLAEKLCDGFACIYLVILLAVCPAVVLGRATLLKSATDVHDQSFDYVIVGGGTSGLTAASTLSVRKPNASILVVEAFDDTREDGVIRSFTRYGEAFEDDRYDWAFRSTVQDINGKSYTLNQGRGLGGSTTINGGVYVLPPLSQLDAIAQLGRAEWSGRDLFESIRQTQDYIAPSKALSDALGIRANMSAHGTDGAVTIGFSDLIQTGPQQRAFLQAQEQALRTPTIDDLGDGTDEKGAAAFFPTTTIPDSGTDRTRVSAATAFVSAPSRLSDRVAILLNTRASKLVLQDHCRANTDVKCTLVASGVELQGTREGPKSVVKAGRVIVAAGALRSPLFLEHSGIGDETILESLGIATKRHLPGVGRNLIEQQSTEVVAKKPAQPVGGEEGPPSLTSMNSLHQLAVNASDIIGFMQDNVGRWATEAVEAGASASLQGLLEQYKTTTLGISNGWPVVEMYLVSTDDAFIQKVATLLSFSRGSVHASTNSMFDPPIWNPRYWTASIDMDMHVAGGRGARKVFQADAMRQVIDGGETKPGFNMSAGGIPTSEDTESFGRWRSYILNTFEPLHHPLGTCAMLPEALGGVVDGRGQVHGVDNVFVIDASVVPIQLSTHLQSIVYGLAAHLAAMMV